MQGLLRELKVLGDVNRKALDGPPLPEAKVHWLTKLFSRETPLVPLIKSHFIRVFLGTSLIMYGLPVSKLLGAMVIDETHLEFLDVVIKGDDRTRWKPVNILKGRVGPGWIEITKSKVVDVGAKTFGGTAPKKRNIMWSLARARVSMAREKVLGTNLRHHFQSPEDYVKLSKSRSFNGQRTGFRYKYNYQPPPGQTNHSCGGADRWADVGSSGEMFCPAGYYCPSTVRKVSCTSGFYCRKGSTSQKRCFKKSSCKPNSSNQDITIFGALLMVALSLVLLIIYNFSGQVLTNRERKQAKSRKLLQGVQEKQYKLVRSGKLLKILQ
ncbi:hypothetical protein HPP92_002774 [Vanilla planifolia]|uniref:Uncharacterized protein n=1 Tax=Vanilla planifolia TaxID=51239 RepID=A0A835VIA0_VANPL|nr:hypothetical protein HPP92_002774 [Vanilla planifolia]